MARLSRGGGLNHFLRELVESHELDSETKVAFAEVATNREFLLALDDYRPLHPRCALSSPRGGLRGCM